MVGNSNSVQPRIVILPCTICGTRISMASDGITIKGRILLNYPAVGCEGNCIDELLEYDDPIECIKYLPLETAVEVLRKMEFLRPYLESVTFFCELFPDAPEIYDAGAVRLHMEGLSDEAYFILERGITSCKNRDLLYIEKAAFRGMEGKPREGLAILEKVKDKGTNPFCTISGNLLKDVQEWEKAAEYWKKAIEIDKSNIFPWNNLGYYYLHVKKDHSLAELHYRQATIVFPAAPQFLAYLGDVLFFSAKYVEAKDTYKKALISRNISPELRVDVNKMIKECDKHIS